MVVIVEILELGNFRFYVWVGFLFFRLGKRFVFFCFGFYIWEAGVIIFMCYNY